MTHESTRKPRSNHRGGVKRTSIPSSNDNIEKKTEKSAAAASVVASVATVESVAAKAFEIWKSHGCRHGNDLQDWLQAEQELNKN
jgi:hypothetical protein